MIKIIKILNDNKCLFRFKLNETPERYNSHQGEVDIILEPAKNNYFEKTSIQEKTFRKQLSKPVDSISWHGFYDNREKDVKIPVIRFKHNGKVFYQYRHTGTICQRNIFLFPICSVYIPVTLYISDLPSELPEQKTEYIFIKDNENVRIDFFVLPKNISVDEFTYLSPYVQLFSLIADISVFNKSLNGELINLKENPEYNIDFCKSKVLAWDVFIRFVYYKIHTSELDLCKHYSVLFHDPNDTIDMLLNHKIAFPNENGSITWSSVRDKHLEALTKRNK